MQIMKNILWPAILLMATSVGFAQKPKTIMQTSAIVLNGHRNQARGLRKQIQRMHKKHAASAVALFSKHHLVFGKSKGARRTNGRIF
jgi:hypothetical protein